jgi:hypothetical protein
MSDAVLFTCPRCGAHRQLDTRPADERVRCLRCAVFSPHAGRLFNSADWKAAQDPYRMAAVLTGLGREPSERKWRLLACAIGRTSFDWCRNPWFRDALAAAAAWADSGEPPPGSRPCAEELGRMDIPDRFVTEDDSNGRPSNWRPNRLERLGWVRIALRALAADPQLRPGDLAATNRAFAANLLRDLVTNPFGAPGWNREWSTSTARELAAHIYASGEFGAMPILADALQDAGCENRHVLKHARVEKLHARGCWLLDAVLGRS